jgi:hypothetical protein
MQQGCALPLVHNMALLRNMIPSTFEQATCKSACVGLAMTMNNKDGAKSDKLHSQAASKLQFVDKAQQAAVNSSGSGDRVQMQPCVACPPGLAVGYQ